MTFQTLQITDLNTNQAATYTAIQEHFGPYFIIFLIIQCSYYVISYTLLLTWRLNAILFRCLGFLISYTVIVLLAHKSTGTPFGSSVNILVLQHTIITLVTGNKSFCIMEFYCLSSKSIYFKKGSVSV